LGLGIDRSRGREVDRGEAAIATQDLDPDARARKPERAVVLRSAKDVVCICRVEGDARVELRDREVGAAAAAARPTVRRLDDAARCQLAPPSVVLNIPRRLPPVPLPPKSFWTPA